MGTRSWTRAGVVNVSWRDGLGGGRGFICGVLHIRDMDNVRKQRKWNPR